jgi:ribosomal protein S18 acetylase RimI-like enzyme
MDIRPFSDPDIEGMRRVARASLDESYPMIGADAREALVEELYAPESLADGDTDAIVRVAVVDGSVVGVAQAERVDDDEGKILWIHVHPDHRGAGIGSELFDRVRDALVDTGGDRISAEVIAENEAGAAFYEDRGFERRSERTIEIGDETFVEAEYVEQGDPERGVRPVETDAGPVYVDLDDSERGSRGAFHPTYSDRTATERHGWFCAECESTDVAMDTMGRIACSGCENRRKPTRWDAAYL